MNPLKMFEEINHPRPLPASLKDRAKLLANFVLETLMQALLET
jgi:hypothetical protein